MITCPSSLSQRSRCPKPALTQRRTPRSHTRMSSSTFWMRIPVLIPSRGSRGLTKTRGESTLIESYRLKTSETLRETNSWRVLVSLSRLIKRRSKVLMLYPNSHHSTQKLIITKNTTGCIYRMKILLPTSIKLPTKTSKWIVKSLTSRIFTTTRWSPKSWPSHTSFCTGWGSSSFSKSSKSWWWRRKRRALSSGSSRAPKP